MRKKLLLFGLGTALFSTTLTAQCTANATIDDDFESYTASSSAGLPDCWSKIATGPMIGLRNTAGESNSGTNFINIYTFFTPNANVYIISPELSTIDGNHFAEFYVRTAYSDVTLEYGTMSDNSDASTFVSAGTGTLGSDVYTKITTANIATISGHKYFAIKFVAPTMHSGIKIDDFFWGQGESNLSIEQTNEPEISIFPNPTADFAMVQSTAEGIYILTDLAGKVVDQDEVSKSGTTKIDLASINAGTYLYLLTIQTKEGNYSRRIVKQ